MTPSADGKGRTIFEILTGRNKKVMTPVEFQYHNPLRCKVGNTMCFGYHPKYSNINFVVNSIVVYEIVINRQKFYYTDYVLKGITLEMDTPVWIRLRMMKDENQINELGSKLILLEEYEQCQMSDDLRSILEDETGEFHVNQDDEGNELEEPRRYYRIDDIKISLDGTMTVLKDRDGDGSVSENELAKKAIETWHYHRNTEDDAGNSFLEYLFVEMISESNFCYFYRGSEVLPDQVQVI